MAKQDQFDSRMAEMDAAIVGLEEAFKAIRDELAEAGTISDANLATIAAKIARLKMVGGNPA